MYLTERDLLCLCLRVHDLLDLSCNAGEAVPASHLAKAW